MYRTPKLVNRTDFSEIQPISLRVRQMLLNVLYMGTLLDK